MLDTKFPRILGDIGNAMTWPFPVLYQTVKDASANRVVRDNASGLLESFIAAGKELEELGAKGITTSCGFLSLFQKELTASLSVPVLTSSLMQVEMINRMMPEGKKAGILTIAKSALSERHLRLANVPTNTPIGTTEGGLEFTRAILNDEDELDVKLAREDNVEAAIKLTKDYPELGAIVLECTNMAPYASDIQRATGLPVYSIETLVSWLYAGVSPRHFD